MSSLKMILNVLMIRAKEEGTHSPEMMDSLQSANEISEQLFSLLDNLLKWTRSQLGKLEAVPHSIHLAELTEGVIEVLSIVAAAKNITIKLSSVPVEETEIFVDIDMIKMAIRNLLSNAIKFSHSGSEINIVITSANEEVCLEVIDQGVGISEEDQCNLMGVGTHFTTYGTEHESGSGLGLLLVKEFIKLNNGRLFFSSKEGQGSTFGFTLPVPSKPA
jgi:two-component system sensor histidine kinase/response regulator